MSEVFQVESVQSCGRDMFLLLAPDSLWRCPFYRKGTRKNSSWEGEGINALCQLIGQWVTDSFNRGIDSRKEIDLWLLHIIFGPKFLLLLINCSTLYYKLTCLFLMPELFLGTITIIINIIIIVISSCIKLQFSSF